MDHPEVTIVHTPGYSQGPWDLGHYTAGNTRRGGDVVDIVMTAMTPMTPIARTASAKPAPGVLTVHDAKKGGKAMVLFRQELGDVLRDARRSQGRTLRQVSSDARVSLGYLSEIERGQKEASSELLHSVTDALGLPLSFVLREVSDRIATAEGVAVPDTVPAELTEAQPLVGAR